MDDRPSSIPYSEASTACAVDATQVDHNIFTVESAPAPRPSLYARSVSYLNALRERRTSRAYEAMMAPLRANWDFVCTKDQHTIAEVEHAAARDWRVLQRFMKHPSVGKLAERSTTRADFYARDRARLEDAQDYKVFVSPFIDSLPRKGTSRLLPYVRQNTFSTIEHTVQIPVLISRGEHRLAAQVTAERQRLVAHNKAVEYALGDGFGIMSFHRAAHALPMEHRLLIRYAFRLTSIRYGDGDTVWRARFSLIYDRGRAEPEVPFNGPLSEVLPAIFREAYGQDIWTPEHTVGRLKQIGDSHPVADELLMMDDIKPVYATLKGILPEVGEFLKA